MVTEQTIDTKRIMKQFYLSILCLAFIAGGGISTAVQASDKADSTTNRRYVGKLDSIQKINEVIIVGTPVIPKYREVIPAQVLKEVDLQRLNSLSVADAIRYFAGVQLKDYGGVGGLKTVNIRSMGTNHMAVFYDGIQLGNAFLKPEYAEQFNVGLKYTRNFEKSPFMRMLDVSVDAYYNKITDKIIAYPKGQQFRWTMLNLGEVEIKGVDAVLNALFTLGKLEVTTKFQYTYQKAIDITDPADTYYRDQIPYIPWHSGSAILALFYKGWGLNYSFIYTGQRYNQQENIPRNHTQPWYTSDLSLQKTFKIRTRTLKATAEVNNLFGQDYDVVLNYPMPKTNFRFVVSVDL